MSSVSFACRHCRRNSDVPVSRLFNAWAIKCDHCSALTGLSETQRLSIMGQAVAGPSPADSPDLKPSRR